MHKKLNFGLAIFCAILYSNLVVAQTPNPTLPISTLVPFISQDSKASLNVSVHNFGIKAESAFRIDETKFVALGLQMNSGNISFDPLHFKEHAIIESEDLVSRLPKPMLYLEPGFGWSINHRSQLIEIMTGIGLDLYNASHRMFIQFNWGGESDRLYAGLFGRLNLINNTETVFSALNAGVVGKIKFSDLSIYNKFEYMIPWEPFRTSMIGIFSIGIEYYFKYKI